MEPRFSKFMSFFFQPLLMPTLAMAILVHMPVYFAVVIPSQARWMLMGLVFFTTFILPASFIFFMMKRGMIHSLYIDSREQRTIPYLISGVNFLLCYYLLRNLQLSPVYSNFMIGAVLLVSAVLLINLFWKISSHMAAVGALTGMCMGLSGFVGMFYMNLILSSVLISGVVGYARLRLNAHTPAQVYAGFALGLALIGVLFMYL